MRRGRRAAGSARGPPLQPVITGTRTGSAVHQVGIQGSSEWRNAASRSGSRSSHRGRRKRRTMRTAAPISIASHAARSCGGSGSKRMVPACRTPSGTVTIARGASKRRPFEATMRTRPRLHSTDSTGGGHVDAAAVGVDVVPEGFDESAVAAGEAKAAVAIDPAGRFLLARKRSDRDAFLARGVEALDETHGGAARFGGGAGALDVIAKGLLGRGRHAREEAVGFRRSPTIRRRRFGRRDAGR